MKTSERVTVRLTLTDSFRDKTIDLEVSPETARALKSLYQSDDDYEWGISDITIVSQTELPKVNLDPDHQGHLVGVICQYLNHIRMNVEEYLMSDDTDSRISKTIELADTFYFAGNIEGRILSNNATIADVELVGLWEAELEEDDEEEECTLVVSSHLPAGRATQTTWFTARIRRKLQSFNPGNEPTIAWLTADVEEYGSIQMVLKIPIDPGCAEATLEAVQAALSNVDMSIDDYWTESK